MDTTRKYLNNFWEHYNQWQPQSSYFFNTDSWLVTYMSSFSTPLGFSPGNGYELLGPVEVADIEHTWIVLFDVCLSLPSELYKYSLISFLCVSKCRWEQRKVLESYPRCCSLCFQWCGWMGMSQQVLTHLLRHHLPEYHLQARTASKFQQPNLFKDQGVIFCWFLSKKIIF